MITRASKIQILIFLLLISVIQGTLFAQVASPELSVTEINAIAQINPEENIEFIISSQYYDDHTQLRHIYLQQTLRSAPIEGIVADLHLDRNNTILSSNSSFIPNPETFCKSVYRKLKPEQAIVKYIHLITKLSVQINPFTHPRSPDHQFIRFSVSPLAEDQFQFRNSYLYRDSTKDIVPTYTLLWKRKNESEWLRVILDANTGESLEKYNELLSCGFEGFRFTQASRFQFISPSASAGGNACYRVFALPAESPIHASRSLVYSPWTKAPNASPFGWHDDGINFYYSSKGNNTDTYEDSDNDDRPTGGDAARAYGGAQLNFDFSLNHSFSPLANKNSSVTNLFYWTNLMHDVWYQYGFTENSGNFQNNNFNKGGIGNDYVQAQSIDNLYYARNNANFGTPVDGYCGMMQMYVWQPPVSDTLIIESPFTIAGKYPYVHTPVSPLVRYPVSSQIVEAEDNSNYPSYACSNLVNPSKLFGKIALVDEGICTFNSKLSKVQNAGAVAILICSNDNNPPAGFGGWSNGIFIPAISLSKQDCQRIRYELNKGVVGTILPTSALQFKVQSNSYIFSRAAYGGVVPNLNAEIIQVLDGGTNPYDACDFILNGNQISGRIAMIEEGNCQNSYKALQAQNFGAVAVVFCQQGNSYPDSIPYGTYGSSIHIPLIKIGNADCQKIRLQLPSMAQFMNRVPQLTDGSFDAGIVCHEYGHGISNRLTGGPGNVACLNNAEQMGEGWSDFFGLVMTIKPGDHAYMNRGMGVYSSGHNTNGVGVRPFPYHVDLRVNPADYSQVSDIIHISQPHGIGYIWCSMLWDLVWAMSNHFGIDSDIYNSNSTKGNNIVNKLVIEGLKLQPCSPGFVDARDAILKADTLLYSAKHARIIWNVFARRGLGWSAHQGSSNNRSDGTAAYNLPPQCSFMSEYELFVQVPLSATNIKLVALPSGNSILLQWSIESGTEPGNWRLVRRNEDSSAMTSLLEFSTPLLNNSLYLDSKVTTGFEYLYRIESTEKQLQRQYSDWVSISLNHDSAWKLYPNPVHDLVKIQLPSDYRGPLTLELYDGDMKLIEQARMEVNKNYTIQLNCNDLIPGAYVIICREENKVHSLKFVKN